MAKTCFYCGKELEAGQRCSCRGSSKTQAAPETAQASASATTSSASFQEAASTGAFSEGSKKKKAKKEKTKQVWNEERKAETRFSFSKFIDQVRSSFPSISKLMRPVMAYIWHPVTTIQNRSQVVSIPKVLLINSLFATLTSLMVIFTSFTDSPFLGMLISLIFGKTDLFSDHPVMAFFVMSAIFWVCVLILALCFTWTSRLVNRKLPFLRALDTVSISSIYMCFADILIFLSVLFGSRGAFTLIFVAMVIMGICHYVSVRHDLALGDNSAFNMLVISYLLFYFLAQLGVNILIRIFVLF
ncbi:MAG: hypothetical protein J5653_10500 [Clostridiales bacterium]|nr:hypothetical protein [Clostridiales bacterium]